MDLYITNLNMLKSLFDPSLTMQSFYNNLDKDKCIVFARDVKFKNNKAFVMRVSTKTQYNSFLGKASEIYKEYNIIFMVCTSLYNITSIFETPAFNRAARRFIKEFTNIQDTKHMYQIMTITTDSICRVSKNKHVELLPCSVEIYENPTITRKELNDRIDFARMHGAILSSHSKQYWSSISPEVKSYRIEKMLNARKLKRLGRLTL